MGWGTEDLEDRRVGKKRKRREMETRRDRLNLDRKCKWKKFAEKVINVIMLF